MELKEILDFLDHEDTRWSSKGHDYIKPPFDIYSEKYLEFAEKDYEEGTGRGLINALSNSKRALDCQIDSLLYIFGLYNFSKKKNWSVPYKIDLIKNIGILAPRVLKKINSVRNLVEHEFVLPKDEQVADFIDIVALFIASTDRYIKDFPVGCQIENVSFDDYWLDFNFNLEQGNVEIKIIFSDKEKNNETIFIESNKPEYIDFYQRFIKVATSY